MGDRKELEYKFYELLGNNNVYFQPPDNVHMLYPCIVYRLDGVYNNHADNKSYHRVKRYSVTHIYKDVRQEKIDEFLDTFKLINYDTRFTSDNLYHDVYTLYW